MSAFFTNGLVVDLILLIMALEAGWLLSRRHPGRPGRVVDILLAFAPGVCLLLALRAVLVGADWPFIAGALAASFPLHLLDLRRRLKPN